MGVGEWRILIVMKTAVVAVEVRVFVRVRVFQQDPFLMAGDILVLIRVFDGNKLFVTFHAFVQGRGCWPWLLAVLAVVVVLVFVVEVQLFR